MSGFSKLFSSIVTSTVWVEDDKTLRTWIAMLALSNATGFVEGSIPGFASLCRMSVEDMQKSIGVLLGPDEFSRSKAHDGRRIEEKPGGWLILNYEEYRNKGQDKQGSRAAYMRQYRGGNKEVQHVTPRNNSLLPVRTEAEAEAVNTKARATRLPADWEMPSEYGNWALGEKPDWDNDRVLAVAADFKDYWIAKAGKDGAKMDWLATWRRWVRNTK